MATEGLSDRMVPDMEVSMKRSCDIEFFRVEENSSFDIHQHFLDVCGDQAVGVSTVRGWVVHFSSGHSDSGSPLLLQHLIHY